jgi:hypothetical protein
MAPIPPPLGKRSAKQLLENAVTIETMATTATTQGVKLALERLAGRFRALAVRRQAEELTTQKCAKQPGIEAGK